MVNTVIRVFYGFVYLVDLAYNMLKSAWEVSLISLKGEIKPQVMEIHTVLRKPMSQTILANSITLTPGTVTIDVDSEKQTLKVAVITPRKQSDVIPFEEYIGKMMGEGE